MIHVFFCHFHVFDFILLTQERCTFSFEFWRPFKDQTGWLRSQQANTPLTMWARKLGRCPVKVFLLLKDVHVIFLLQLQTSMIFIWILWDGPTLSSVWLWNGRNVFKLWCAFLWRILYSKIGVALEFIYATVEHKSWSELMENAWS